MDLDFRLCLPNGWTSCLGPWPALHCYMFEILDYRNLCLHSNIFCCSDSNLAIGQTVHLLIPVGLRWLLLKSYIFKLCYWKGSFFQWHHFTRELTAVFMTVKDNQNEQICGKHLTVSEAPSILNHCCNLFGLTILETKVSCVSLSPAFGGWFSSIKDIIYCKPST